MHSSRWKAIELHICRLFGGERSGPTGRMGPDGKGTEPFALEIKHGAAAPVPMWLQEAMKQAERNAPPGMLPTVVLHPRGWAVMDSLVVFRLSAFREWYVDGKNES